MKAFDNRTDSKDYLEAKRFLLDQFKSDLTEQQKENNIRILKELLLSEPYRMFLENDLGFKSYLENL